MYWKIKTIKSLNKKKIDWNKSIVILTIYLLIKYLNCQSKTARKQQKKCICVDLNSKIITILW